VKRFHVLRSIYDFHFQIGTDSTNAWTALKSNRAEFPLSKTTTSLARAIERPRKAIIAKRTRP
jgi:hypothetical protein